MIRNDAMGLAVNLPHNDADEGGETALLGSSQLTSGNLGALMAKACTQYPAACANPECTAAVHRPCGHCRKPGRPPRGAARQDRLVTCDQRETTTAMSSSQPVSAVT